MVLVSHADELTLFEILPLQTENGNLSSFNRFVKKGAYFKLKNFKTGLCFCCDLDKLEKITRVKLEIKLGKSGIL